MLLNIGVHIKLIEPIMCREPGEFGFGAWLQGSTIPLPTTVAGSLACTGWCRNKKCSENKSRWEALTSCIASLLKSEFGVEAGSVRVKGPLVTDGEKLFVGCAEGLVELSVDGVSEWVERQERGERPGKKAGDAKHRLISLESILQERTGVGLVREKKVVKIMREGEGLLYTAPYIYYYYRGSKNKKTRDLRILDLAVDIIVESTETTKDAVVECRKLPLRLGGEDRKALATLTLNKPRVLSILEGMWREHETNEAVIVLATPMILPRSIAGDGIERNLLEAVEEGIEGFAELDKKEVYSVHPRVRPRITPLQLGFDERSGRKGEIRTALLPGAVFKVRVIGDWRKLYVRGAGELTRIGFGTLLPVPYKK